MTEYLIAFNDEWVPDNTVEELREKSKVLKPLVAEMKAAGVFIFTGGLDDAAPAVRPGRARRRRFRPGAAVRGCPSGRSCIPGRSARRRR